MLLPFIFLLCLSLGCRGDVEPSEKSNNADGGAPDETAVQFTDVTLESGIDFTHSNGASGSKYLPESNGSGAVFFDYDNDEDIDLYLVNSSDFADRPSAAAPTNVLYRNNGDGTFSDVTAVSGAGHPGYGQGAAAADLDNDGDQDLYITNLGANVLYRNNGDGTFTDITELAGVGDTGWGASCAFADFDNDGYLDLYVVNYLDFTLETHTDCSIAGYPVYCGPDSYNGVADVLYHNNGRQADGSITFTDATSSSGVLNPAGKGLGVSVCDYDNDGDVDIYVANDMVRNFLYENQGNGSFKDVSLLTGAGYNEAGQAEAGMGTDFGDFNQDGLMDVLVTNYQGETNTLYVNEGSGLFADVALSTGIGRPSWRYLGWGVRFFDYNNDGDLDIFVANGHINTNIAEWDDIGTYAQKNLLFDNSGPDATPPFVFREISDRMSRDFLQEEVSRGAAFGDYDNDGDMDILVTNVGDAPNLLRNDGGNSNNWLMLKLVGVQSNRDAIGAEVRVVSAGLVQRQQLQGGSSYLSHHDPRLLFGFGKRTKVDSIVVKWPGGTIQTMQNVDVNQMLTVREK